MIVITGEPRAGTSLMMQLMGRIGLEVAGEERPGKARHDARRAARAGELNPKGLYEIPGVVVRGVDDEDYIDEHLSGKAVKIVFPGIGRTPMGKIEKIIYCVRDPREIIHSQRKLTGNVTVSKNGKEAYSNESRKLSYASYFNRTGRFCAWMNGNDVFWDKCLVVDYSDMMGKTKQTVKEICKFLEVEYSDDFLDVIDSSLYRSEKVTIPGYDTLAEDIYLATKSKDVSGVIQDLREYFAEQRLKNRRWVDEDTWTLITEKSFFSYVMNRRGLRTKLMEGLRRRKKLLPTSCEHYNRDGSEYTIKRYSLPDLTRKKVLCQGEERTLEYCLRCRERGLNG